MDRHEPEAYNTPADNEVSAARRVLNGVGNFIKENKNKLTATAVAGVLTLTLAGCGANAHGEGPKPTTTHSAEKTPTPTPTQEKSDRWPGFDFERTDPLPDSLKAAQEMSPDDFAKLPKADQLAYASWLDQYREKFVQTVADDTKSEYDTPYTLTPDSDVYTVGEDYQTTLRIANNFGEGKPTDIHYNGQLDKDDILKYLTAHSMTNNLTEAQSIYDNMDKLGYGNALNIGTQLDKKYHNDAEDYHTATDFKSQPTQVVIEGSAYRGFQVNYTDPDNGTQYAAKRIIYPYKNYKGQEVYTVLGD